MVRVIEGKYLSPVLQRRGLTCCTSECKINGGNSHCSGCEWKMCRLKTVISPRRTLKESCSELATIKSNQIEVLDLICLPFRSVRFDLIDLLYNQRPDSFDLICF